MKKKKLSLNEITGRQLDEKGMGRVYGGANCGACPCTGYTNRNSNQTGLTVFIPPVDPPLQAIGYCDVPAHSTPFCAITTLDASDCHLSQASINCEPPILTNLLCI